MKNTGTFVIKEDEMGRNVACVGGMRNGYNILIRRPEVMRPLGRRRRR
jgi:hypothetical protein